MKTRQDIVKLKMEYRSSETIKNLLMGIIADCDRITTSPSEKQIQDVLKATLKNNKKTLASLEGSKYPDEMVRLSVENEFIERYLPQKMETMKMRTIVNDPTFNSMKEVMMYFKENYVGLYDGAELAKLAKERFS